MRQQEAAMWTRVSKEMKGAWNVDRIETTTATGFPDVVWSMQGVSGMIELKVIPSLTHNKPLVITHLTAEQTNWMMSKVCRGDGRADLMVYAEKQNIYMLIPAILVGSVYERRLRISAPGEPASKYVPRVQGLSRQWLVDQLLDTKRYETSTRFHLESGKPIMVV